MGRTGSSMGGFLPDMLFRISCANRIKREGQMVRIVVVNVGGVGSPANTGDWPGRESRIDGCSLIDERHSIAGANHPLNIGRRRR